MSVPAIRAQHYSPILQDKRPGSTSSQQQKTPAKTSEKKISKASPVSPKASVTKSDKTRAGSAINKRRTEQCIVSDGDDDKVDPELEDTFAVSNCRKNHLDLAYTWTSHLDLAYISALI